MESRCVTLPGCPRPVLLLAGRRNSHHVMRSGSQVRAQLGMEQARIQEPVSSHMCRAVRTTGRNQVKGFPSSAECLSGDPRMSHTTSHPVLGWGNRGVGCEVLSQYKCHGQRSSRVVITGGHTIPGGLTRGKCCHCHHLQLGDLLRYITLRCAINRGNTK